MISKIDSIDQLKEVIGGYRVARLIQTAVKLALFDQYYTPASASEVAERTDMNTRGVEIISDALTAVGLLEKADDRYHNTTLASEMLSSQSKNLLRFSVLHSEGLYNRWAHLDHAVRHGKPFPREKELDTDRETNRLFIMSMHANGFEKSRQIADCLDLSNVQNVIDIAGGPGTYLLALLNKKPDLNATLIDLPLTLETAEQVIRESGFADRFTLKAMDVFEGSESFGSGFDLAILSNILHIEDASRNIKLLTRIHQCLKPGGRLLIQDMFTSEDGTTPIDAAIFSVNMLTATQRGKSWPRATVAQWLKTAGFQMIEMLHRPTESERWIVTA